MAKKTETTDMKETVTPSEELATIKKDNNKKETLVDLTLFDLINLEKASSLICRRYENNIKMYDGSIRQSGFEYEKYKKINNLHSNILNEIEMRLEKLS
jgi:hypothetical protein